MFKRAGNAPFAINLPTYSAEEPVSAHLLLEELQQMISELRKIRILVLIAIVAWVLYGVAKVI